MDRRATASGRRRFLSAGLLVALGGCAGLDDPRTADADGSPVAPPAGGTGIAYTFGAPNGNRLVDGAGDLPNADPVDVAIGGDPAWVVGTAVDGGDLWVVVRRDGSVVAVVLRDGDANRTTITPERLAAGSPPVLDARDGDYRLLRNPDDAGEWTHPTAVGDALVTPTASGAVAVARPDGDERLGVDALPDGRVVTDGSGRAAVLAAPTDRYRHGALGDRVEPTAVAIVDVTGAPSVAGTVSAPAPAVFETLLPFWLSWRDRPVFVLTEAVSGQGARAAIYAESGDRLATGPRVDGGLGWTHQLAVAPFAPDGTTELATVAKPHVDHDLRFLRWRGDRLEPVATASPWVSHTLDDPRNLDRVRAGDFDGDGRVELLVPAVGGDGFGALRRTERGIEAAWRLDLGGSLVTNLATTDGPTLSVAAGRSDGVLRVWPSHRKGN